MNDFLGSTLDLRKKGELPIGLLKKIAGLDVEVGKDYTEYIGNIALENSVSELDWLIGMTNRDPYHNQLFDDFCKLKILDYCLTNEISFDTIVVDNNGMCKAVEDICKGYNIKCNVEINKGKKRNVLFRVLYNFTMSCYVALISFIIPRVLPKNNFHPNGPVMYVDTFIRAANFDQEGVFTDNYYDGMIDKLSHQSSIEVCYVPVLYGIKTPADLKWIIEKSRRSDFKFLLMEESLKLYDYLYALFMSFYLPLKIKSIPSYHGIDVSYLVNHELRKDLFSLSLFRSILIYRFIRRLKNSGVELKQVIDWNENQLVDRALNLAIRKYYSGIPIVGYQGYVVSEYYVSHSPADYEVMAGTIPDCIGVISPKLIDRKKRFYSKQKVILAPAFRMKNLLKYEGYKKGGDSIILLALPSHIDMCKNIINICMDIILPINKKFVIKIHPSISKESFISLVPQVQSPQFQFATGPLSSYFSEASLLISSNSSACFEAISSGVYVAIIGELTNIPSNPVDGIFEQCYWDICYEPECLQDIIDMVRETFEFDVDELLTPVTEKTVKTFLECHT